MLSLAIVVDGCTNILVSKGASADNSTHLSYNADASGLYGSLSHYPAADHPAGATREIWDWDGSFFLGTIPEVAHTYNVVGNSNEHGLVIGETTFGGLPELGGGGTGAIMDYGSLIWVTLQRAKTAREAISTMDALVQAHGYASEGESFSIADGDEVWLMEMIGKGKERGAVWVAMRVPEGHIGSTANQARVRTFPMDDEENCRYAKDVVSFAQAKGLYPPSAPANKFSFSDTFDPPNFHGVRLGEARVFHIFQPASGGAFSE
jgi:dipeptidase